MQGASVSVRSLSSSSFVRFAGVGLLSTVLDMAVLNVASIAGANIYLATFLGFMAGLTNGFLLNTRYVFGKERNVVRYVKYGLVSFGGLLLTELIMHYVAVDPGHLEKNIAKLIAVGIVFFWNYFLSKHWAFK